MNEITAAEGSSSSEYDELAGCLKKLHTELSMLVLERDELKYVICKNIETEYMMKLGGLEYKVYKEQCGMLRMKRKIELVQANINRQEKIDLSAIEAVLDEEFAEYQQCLEEQINNMNEAILRSHATTLTFEETKEIKQLYRKIVKSLHPDLNPDITEDQLNLFYRSVSAYENGDLTTLRAVADMITEPVLPEMSPEAAVLMRKEEDRLRKLLDRLNADIAAIKEEYPYTMKELLEDPEKIRQRRQELTEQCKAYRDSEEMYRTRLQGMLKGQENG